MALTKRSDMTIRYWIRIDMSHNGLWHLSLHSASVAPSSGPSAISDRQEAAEKIVRDDNPDDAIFMPD